MSEQSVMNVQTAAYVALDDQINSAESNGILDRWRFGKMLLKERVGKQLPRGRLDEVAEACGKSQTEIKYRMLFATKFPTESKVVNAVDDFGSWHNIVNDALPDTAHVGHAAGDSEWYTPPEFIEAAVATMGGIDLDPASTAEANRIVKAEQFFAAGDDGLTKVWAGRVWMNPPYSQPLIAQFVEKLIQSYESNDVSEACVLVNNATETDWFQMLLESAASVCFPRGRVRFWHPSKQSAPLQGQGIVYVGSHGKRFANSFSDFGPILVIP